LISAASELPEKQRKRLENSWAGAFYKEFFSRIDEQSFAVLYSEKDSRPNVPVNVLVGLEAMQAGSAGAIKVTVTTCVLPWKPPCAR
jgi:hypothetical protein